MNIQMNSVPKSTGGEMQRNNPHNAPRSRKNKHRSHSSSSQSVHQDAASSQQDAWQNLLQEFGLQPLQIPGRGSSVPRRGNKNYATGSGINRNNPPQSALSGKFGPNDAGPSTQRNYQNSATHSRNNLPRDQNEQLNGRLNQTSRRGPRRGNSNSSNRGLPRAQYQDNEPEFSGHQRRHYNSRDNIARDTEENRDGNHRHNKFKTNHRLLRFRALEEIANSEDSEILTKIYEKKSPFMNLINATIEDDDFYVLIMRVIMKICNSVCDQIKLNVLLELCNSNFIKNFRNYLMDLPYQQRKVTNNLYWKDQNDFWKNFIVFSEYIIMVAPSVAFHTCLPLIDASSKACLEGLRDRHGYLLPEELDSKLKSLRDRLVAEEKQDREKLRQPKKAKSYDIAPPDDFRQLSVIPTKDDLIGEPFLRPNIVNGAYIDVEHYLDVQFRLLREDCFGPVREGINQFIGDPTRKKYDNIRVYENVKFIAPYVSNNKVGSMIQLDNKTIKRFKRINWAHSKRFIFGSLLIFTKDRCQSILIATILEREVKFLERGQIPVSLVEAEGSNVAYNDDLYVMVESEVYFEPYYHVLKALQDPMFPQDLVMTNYIVKVEPNPNYPQYLGENSEYVLELCDSDEVQCQVLNDVTWPTSEELGLNESQYAAYQLALTREFAVIQGPPGTGKTFLGVKVATTLLENVNSTGCLMFVVCYTNHALDQFLEAMLKVTNSIVRIGNRSKNEAMESRNLLNLRRQHKTSNMRMFREYKHNLKMSMIAVRELYEKIDIINDGVLSYTTLIRYIPEIVVIAEVYKKKRQSSHADPIKEWLFEGSAIPNFNDIVHNDVAEEMEETEVKDDNIFARDAVELDDLDDDEYVIPVNEQNIKTSFVLRVAEKDFVDKIKDYTKCNIKKEKDILRQEIIHLKSIIDAFKEMSNHRDRPSCINSEELYLYDPSVIPMIERWSLYFKWANIVTDEIKTVMKPLQEKLDEANTSYEESRMCIDLEILKNVKIVGMTTSGAARLQKLLKALAPTIVIVEEAAEVLEAHIITSLTKSCQHLILIGDHQQLRPSAACTRLARHFGLEISLFERMIMNNVHSRRLGVQHRMRPEIASLISPHIYEDLQNHHSVERFPNVRGVTVNMFFLSHNYKEEEVEDSATKCNPLEADLTLGLANYLMQQGYDPEDVTILAAYTGQLFYMKKHRGNYSHLSKVKITVVDNYQGEESKIILLSLVRNNAANKIGFLGTENRVCVALSRAREGFYILGNIDILTANSELWRKIGNSLTQIDRVGPVLKLKCESHGHQITSISSPKDFKKVPEGGCLLKCSYNLPCGHPCPLVCHGYDRGHSTTKCIMKCERLICEQEHACPLPCSMKCQPCKVSMVKTLPCKHQMTLPCYRDPNDPSIMCNVIVDVVMPYCGHQAKKPCHKSINTMPCPVPCKHRVAQCGHECLRTCHVNDDPDHEEYVCEKPCAKAKTGCSAGLLGDRGEHQCKKKCHEPCDECDVQVLKRRSTCRHPERIACSKNLDDVICREKCARMLSCNHHCKKKCFEKCGDCQQQVKKVIHLCQHEVVVACGIEPNLDLCTQQCRRVLPCGHPCKDLCRNPCDPDKCAELIQRNFKSPCGHDGFLPCRVFNLAFTGQLSPSTRDRCLLENCSEPCNQTLECGHVCAGTCSQCRQGRIHAPCTQTCHQTLICGHECEEPCNQLCPPCKKPCEVRCDHSNCSKPCGAPCAPCQEECKRSCAHGSCSRRCGEPCSRAACAEPCARRLRCQHRCRGLCGEPCPDICHECRPDQFPKDFLGDDFEDTDKFVKLQDCSHILEVGDMDNLMTGDTETVQIRKCPMCRKPIVNTHRYKDIVNEMYKSNINPIKEKVYGTLKQINDKKQILKDLLANVVTSCGGINTVSVNTAWKKAYTQIHTKLNNPKATKKMSLINLEISHVYINILEILGKCSLTFINDRSTELRDELHNQINIICRVLIDNSHKISQQQQKDINSEIKRTDYIVQLSKILSHAAYNSNPEVMKLTQVAKGAVLSMFEFNESNTLEALKQLEEAVKVSGIVTKQERDLVVKAIGLKAGHWYKCPNGHFYCIGECGGAMAVGKCIECGEAVGGTQHRLLGTNRHAGEMDGSRFSAWSDQYNNMGNYQL